VKFGRQEISEIVHCLPYKRQTKKSPGSTIVATVLIAPKISQGQPPDNVLKVLQILSKSVHLRRSYSRTCEHC